MIELRVIDTHSNSSRIRITIRRSSRLIKSRSWLLFVIYIGKCLTTIGVYNTYDISLLIITCLKVRVIDIESIGGSITYIRAL